MAEQVVDRLEPVEVQQHHRKELAAGRRSQRLLQPLPQHDAVGHAGQPVVAGQEGHLLLGPLLSGDVVEGGNEAAVGQRFDPDADGYAWARFLDHGGALPGLDAPHPACVDVVRIKVREAAAFLAAGDKVAEPGAGPHVVRRQAIDFAVVAVGGH